MVKSFIALLDKLTRMAWICTQVTRHGALLSYHNILYETYYLVSKNGNTGVRE